MLPSRRLVILVALAAPLFFLGAAEPVFVTVAAFYLAMLGLYATLDALLLPRRRRLVVRRIVPERLSLGAPARIEIEIENRARRPMQIRLAEDLPPDMEAEPHTVGGSFDAGATGRLEYRLTPKKRGRYVLDALDVRLLPVGGLWHRQMRLGVATEVHVFPNLVNLKRYELLIRRGMLSQQGLARMRRIGQGTEFESLRRYAHGDAMGRVDWKATAKRRRLIVRNYQPEREQSVLVALDVGRATAGEFAGISRLDYMVNAALMLAYAALRQGDWFSLVAFSDRIESYLAPTRGVKTVERVARALYRLQPRLVESDYGAACRFLSLKNRKRSLICLMTDVIDRDASDVIIGYMARFARWHLPLAVTLANPEVRRVGGELLALAPDPYRKAAALDVLAAREEALAAMRHHGVGVLDVEPPELTPELINRYLLIKSTRRL